MESYLVGIPTAAQGLDVSKRTIKRLIADGDLDMVTIGRRALIPVASIEAFYTRILEGADLRPTQGRFDSSRGNPETGRRYTAEY